MVALGTTPAARAWLRESPGGADMGSPLPLDIFPSLKGEDHPTLPGMTLFSDERFGRWLKPTGIYIPPSVDIDKGPVNVVLWLHGWYVDSIESLFYRDRSQPREQVLASKKNVILVAPWLGSRSGEKDPSSSYRPKDLNQGSFGEIYLKQVLAALAALRDPDADPDPAPSVGDPWTPQWSGIGPGPAAGPQIKLRDLIIGCHSGGGEGMRYLVGNLGRYRFHLKECWGFDCLYGVDAVPDTASFWYDWVSGDGRPLSVFYGKSTVFHSVKLDLMGRGLATREGGRRDPPGAAVSKLQVTLGIDSARGADDLMGLDALTKAAPPKRGSKDSNDFVKQAADNLTKAAPWPGDLMEMHYGIARNFFLARLKAAGYL
jgi:hypothetical protein